MIKYWFDSLIKVHNTIIKKKRKTNKKL